MDGMICKHCGFQESDHGFGKAYIKANPIFKKKLPGREKPLSKCPGFEPEDEELAKELASEAEKEKAERTARQFGHFRND